MGEMPYLDKDNIMDRNQALQMVAHEIYVKNFDVANEMLGIIERSIKEDRESMVTTNTVRFANLGESNLFTLRRN